MELIDQMNDVTIYNNYKKALLKILFGIGCIVGGIILLYLLKQTFIYICGSLVVFGISIIFFALKSFSRKPLFIFSERGLFIGFKANKWVNRENIVSIIIKQKHVDNRLIDFIEITMKFNINAPSNRLMKEFPIENINMDTNELYKVIREFMKNNKTVFNV